MEPSVMISLVSASTALVATIVGPLVTLSVAKRQFSERVISPGRQKWIETLRDMIAELIAQFVVVLAVKQGWQGKWNKGLDVIAKDPSYLVKLERLVLTQWKIRLLINPAEPD